MNRARRLLLQHSLTAVFERAVDSLCAALHPDTTRHYHGTAHNFLVYLSKTHPEVTSLDLIRRDPHILGWMSRLRAQTPPLVTASYINLLLALRRIFTELAWMEQHPELAHLIRTQDIPRLPHRLPRPLTAEQDQLLQQEFLRRNDLGANAFLLIRHTGMRIGECVDLSFDCLRSTGPDQWAVHIPLGKLKTERMVPVDSFVRDLVYHLRFFRSLDPLPADGRLFARRHGKEAILHLSSLLLAPSLLFPRSLHPHRAASVQAYLCLWDASSWCGLSGPHEITRPYRSRNDLVLPRSRGGGPPS